MKKQPIGEAPVWRMRKDEIVKLSHWRCRHSHTGLSHYSCWLKEHPETERIGIIDGEMSNLKADFGMVICYDILNLKTNEHISRIVTKEELFDTSCDPDFNLIQDCVRDMMKFDRLIGFYSGDYRFDIPFFRTRAVSQNIAFPGHGSIYFEDVYSTMKSKFCLSSNRLENSVRTLIGHSLKTHWMAKHWVRAIQGRQESLDYIMDHCRKDTEDLKELYLKIYPFSKHSNKSI